MVDILVSSFVPPIFSLQCTTPVSLVAFPGTRSDGASFDPVFAELRSRVASFRSTTGISFVRHTGRFSPKVDQVATALGRQQEREEGARR
mmetsp:Transcript_4755/g.15373  ORF Transcript_4755/g.15373 Transcript_4755/m.15373 type:complete len:90 (+) Transcript_4755:127-396(+)